MATNNSWNNQILAAGGPITLNSGTGAVNVSSDASATTVNVATGGAVKSVSVGSTNSTSATTVQSGSGALNVTSTNGALTINSGTGALGVSTDASATTISIGTGAAAKTLSVGSTNTTSTTTLQAGSGGVKLGSVAEGALVTSSTSVISTVTGTAGYVFKANTAGTAPSFQDFSGNAVLIQNIPASSSGSIAFTSGVTGYEAYKILIYGMIPQTNNTQLLMTFSTDGGGTYESTNYYQSGNAYGSNATIGGAFNVNNGSSINLGNAISNSTTFAFCAEIHFFLLGSSSVAKNGFLTATYKQQGATELYTSQIGFALNLATAINGIKFTMSSGNINSGTFKLYGIV